MKRFLSLAGCTLLCLVGACIDPTSRSYRSDRVFSARSCSFL